MGLVIEGKWSNDDTVTTDTRGSFIRDASKLRQWVTADGSPGPSGDGGFQAEPGRYHLFVSPSCPWAHRTIIMRKLKKLEDAVSMSISDRPKTEGWCYSQGIDDLKPGTDGIFRLHQVYTATRPDYTGKITVPTLWDRKRRTIVNNESSEIIRMFNSAFNQWADTSFDFYPEKLRAEIDEVNDFVYEHVNNGVYRTGFAKSQEAYDEAVRKVFHGLDTLEERLPSAATSSGSALPRRTGGRFQRCCASISSTMLTSSVTSAVSRTTRTSPTTCASSISGRASRRPPTFIRPRQGTTASGTLTPRVS